MKLFCKKKPGLILLLTIFSFYCLLSPGNLPGDTEIRWSVSRHFIRTFEFTIENHINTRYYATGVDGRRYSFWGPGQQVILLPFACAGLLLEKTLGIPPQQADLIAQFFASILLFPCLGAISVWLFFQCVLLLGYATKTAFLSALTFGFATMHVHYTVFAHEQSQVALLLLLQLFYMLKILKTHRPVYVWGFCIAMGLCLFFRISSVCETMSIFVVCFGASIIKSAAELKRTMFRVWCGAFVAACCPFIISLACYNVLRFGNIFETGYGIAAKTMFGGIGAFEAKPIDSLLGILFSPGKSIFLYNPVLIFSFIGFFSFFRRNMPIGISILSASVANILFNSFYTTWSGDYAWSCRYQASILPFLTMPITSIFYAVRRRSAKTMLCIVVAVSIIIQIASVTYSFHLEFIQNPNHGLIPGKYIWQWKESHLVKRFENIFLHALGRRKFESVKVINEVPHLMQTNRTVHEVKIAYTINFFPFKAYAMQISDGIVYALTVLWIIFAMLLLSCLLKIYEFLAD